mgnify:CR=1 FL=1
MTNNQLTREQAEDTIEGLEELISRGLQSVYLDMALAGMRHLLASMDGEPAHEATSWQVEEAIANMESENDMVVVPRGLLAVSYTHLTLPTKA